MVVVLHCLVLVVLINTLHTMLIELLGRLSENLDLSENKVFRIDNKQVLSSSSLGQGVTGSSLTTVGTLTNLRTDGNVGIGKTLSELSIRC